jgi:iron(III) transport system permease protein
MTAWRWVACGVLAVLVGLPLVQPFARLGQPAAWAWTAEDLARVSQLALNTLLLAGATCLIAVPLGTLLAVLVFRTSFLGQRLFMALLLFTLFVPLPVIVSSWQALLGSGGLWPIELWVSAVDRPWATGWLPAIWIHAIAAVPWVAFIVGLGLRWVEPELEEAASLQVPPWRVLFQVTLPRCRASILAASLFVALQTAGEISVTDMMLISTLAEETYTQFIGGDEGLARTLVLALPGTLLLIGTLGILGSRLERALPPLPATSRTAPALRLVPPATSVVIVAAYCGVLLIPLAALVWRLGEAGAPRAWSVAHAAQQLAGEARLFGVPVIMALATALAAGVAVAAVALVCTWLAARSPALRLFLLIVCMAAWVTPGPVIGIGEAECIRALPDGPWLAPLYYAPSPLPILWAHFIRFLPPALFFLWPVVRLIPREVFEAAELEGATPLDQLRHVVWPMTRRSAGVIALAVAALALGEHEAAGRAATPGWDPFAKLLFDRMHYGADSNVAALSLLLLAGIALAGIAALAIRQILRAVMRSPRPAPRSGPPPR